MKFLFLFFPSKLSLDGRGVGVKIALFSIVNYFFVTLPEPHASLSPPPAVLQPVSPLGSGEPAAGKFNQQLKS